MFQITQYLQFRNTPDGKPRVLVEGVDFNWTYKDWLEMATTTCQRIAKRSDCRPLLSVEDKSELDIFNYFYPENELKDKKWVDTNTYHLLSFNGKNWTVSNFKFLADNTRKTHDWNLIQESLNLNYNPTLQEPRAKFEKIGNFADDPAKYLQLLWNCTEKEGWQRVFELLNITL